MCIVNHEKLNRNVASIIFMNTNTNLRQLDLMSKKVEIFVHPRRDSLHCFL